MRLSWNEIRARAAAFAEEWADAHYEKGESQSFYNDFFEVFGVRRRKVASFEAHVEKLGGSHGFIDLFWPGVLLVEQKSAGRDLEAAKTQAFDYFTGLKDAEYPRFLLLSDFQNFELYDLEEDHAVFVKLADLPKHIEDFAFILGVQKRKFRDQPEVNVNASYLMGELHDALEEAGISGHDLERYLVRLLFCMFADDTGIFEPKDIMLDLLHQRTAEDGSNIGGWLQHLFQTLNTPEDARASNLDEDLAQFPYVNGDLFADPLPIPSFDAAMRQKLIRACEFQWMAISPAIFGAMFQSVMDKKRRREIGGHYTTEKNILKVIGPLFLDELRTEFEGLRKRKRDRVKLLTAFHDKLAGLRFLDPACGCGNFLVITYRELRELELEVLEALQDNEQLELDAEHLSRIDVDQFYGIEIEEFPARIAETAMWMMDHIMNSRFSLAFGQVFVRIPLTTSPHIRHADALATDWREVIAPADCDYVFGNPPFIGSKFQSADQRAQVRRVAQLGGSGGTLDYVAAWFITAGAFVAANPACRIGFVATNSITQGEQVAQLWPVLFGRCGLEIDYAHRTFAWGSDARGMAHVHVVIIGLSHRSTERETKRLFSYPDIKGDPVESTHNALTAYLFGADTVEDRHLVVEDRSKPLCDVPRTRIGSKPIDGGHFIFTDEEKDQFLSSEPNAGIWLRPYIGAQEFINGGGRWILVLHDAPPDELRASPAVRERIEAVRAYRLDSRSAQTRELANTPTLYHVNVIPDQPYVALPEVSSERRDYIPIGWLKPPIVPSNLLRVILTDNRWYFGILTSHMHMAWLIHIGGRLESRYRYGIGIVYNTFPWPEASEAQKKKVRVLAQDVLDARAAHPTSTLADLYDPDTMPPNLRKAHRALDRAVDLLYQRGKFADDRARVERLFAMYEALIATED